MAYTREEGAIFESQGLCSDCGGSGCSYCEGTGNSDSVNSDSDDDDE
ncbi:hypothetical protein GAB14E_2652 [Colwellia psychrerythraea]|uniref:Uncharacterized protein n=1 Tax=Colwellia psychrerythraea TaxID=28229 RepID=A0A099KUJ1_COLPS|nr:hypothetical protein GAB14E_2652 [Colwellia psychrerythraea]